MREKPTALNYFANKKAQIFSPKCPQDTFGGASGGGGAFKFKFKFTFF